MSVYAVFSGGSRGLSHNTNDLLERWKLQREGLAKIDDKFDPKLTPLAMDIDTIEGLDAAVKVAIEKLQLAILDRDKHKSTATAKPSLLWRLRNSELRARVIYWQFLKEFVTGRLRWMRDEKRQSAHKSQDYFRDLAISESNLSPREYTVIQMIREGRFDKAIRIVSNWQAESCNETVDNATP